MNTSQTGCASHAATMKDVIPGQLAQLLPSIDHAVSSTEGLLHIRAECGITGNSGEDPMTDKDGNGCRAAHPPGPSRHPTNAALISFQLRRSRQ
jgi:hypothetical protein